MKAYTVSQPPEDIRQEWRRLNAVVEDLMMMQRTASSHPELIMIRMEEDGLLLDCTGLVKALQLKGIDLNQL